MICCAVIVLVYKYRLRLISMLTDEETPPSHRVNTDKSCVKGENCGVNL